MVNAQEWLDRDYPFYQRGDYTEIDISHKKLSGSLNLRGFSELKKLDCSFNQITDLDLNGCRHLEEVNCSFNKIEQINLNFHTPITKFHCSDNLLTSFWFFYSLNAETSTELYLDSNDLPREGLSRFGCFKNLKKLWIGNNRKSDISRDIYNRFTGSLRPLFWLMRLEELDINNTNLDKGLNYLPDSLERINYLKKSEKSPEAKSNRLLAELKPYLQQRPGSRYYDIVEWRTDNFPYYPRFFFLYKENEKLKEKNTSLEEENANLEEELQMEREEAKKALEKAKEWRERQLKEITAQKDREIQELKAQLEKLQLQAQIQVSPK